MDDYRLLKEEFLDNGYCIVRGAINGNFLDLLEADISKLIEDIFLQKTNVEAKHIHYLDSEKKIVSSMHNLVDFLQSYKEFILNNPYSKLFEFLIDDELGDWVYNSSYFTKPPNGGLETVPHQDNAFFNMLPSSEGRIPKMLTCWFGLDDSDESNGALYYYRGSHRFGPMTHYPVGNLGASMALKNEDLVKLSKFPKQTLRLKRGDMVIHNAWVVHGSGPNFSSRRRGGLNFSRVGASCKRDEAGWSNYLDTLNNFLASRK